MMGGCHHGTERDHRCHQCEPETPAERRQKARDKARIAASNERRLRDKAALIIRKARTANSAPTTPPVKTGEG
jgi:hypothetical protein